jgi:hypothetical protein
MELPMADHLLGRIPAWLKSLYEMENELRDVARNGIILRNEKASEHLAAARKHLMICWEWLRGRGLRTAHRRLSAKRARSDGHGKARASQLSPRRPTQI